MGLKKVYRIVCLNPCKDENTMILKQQANTEPELVIEQKEKEKNTVKFGFSMKKSLRIPCYISGSECVSFLIPQKITKLEITTV